MFRNLAVTFGDPGPESPSLAFYRQSVRLRALIGLVLAAVSLIAPGLEPRENLIVGGAVLAYVVFATIVDLLLARRSVTVAVAINIVVGMAAVFAVSVAVPAALYPALFTYILALVFFTVVGGAALGVPVAVLATVCGLIGQWAAPTEDQASTFVLATYLPFMLAIVFVIDGLTRKRRRTTRKFERLYDALRELSPDPDFDSTLESVTRALGEAVGASETQLLLVDEDRLVLATRVDQDELVGRRHSFPIDSSLAEPLRDVFRYGKPIVVPDVEDVPDADATFPEWSDRWLPLLREGGHRSLLFVPLRVTDETIGLLVTCFPWKGALDDEELSLLRSYADQVAIVIVRAEAYDRERRAARRLEEIDRLRSEFLAMVAHELRTPLTASKGFIGTVLTYWDRLSEAERRELLEKADRNQDELSRLTDQLLDFTRLEAGAVTPHVAIGKVDASVDDAVTGLAETLSAHTVVTDLRATRLVDADFEALRRVTANLLSNAAKFSPQGTTVTVGTRDEGDNVVVSVVDEGPGIPEVERERVFEPYYQVERSRHSRMGTGIGLAIARQFVEMHNGRITLDDAPGGGTCASFSIPASASATAWSPDPHPEPDPEPSPADV